jgi:hypothetical protein
VSFRDKIKTPANTGVFEVLRVERAIEDVLRSKNSSSGQPIFFLLKLY